MTILSEVIPQVLGFEVDAINSVQFSNHTGYDHWSGQVLDSNDLKTLYEGLAKNELHLRYTHILSGYARNQSFLETVGDVIKSVKSVNKNAFYGIYYNIFYFRRKKSIILVKL